LLKLIQLVPYHLWLTCRSRTYQATSSIWLSSLKPIRPVLRRGPKALRDKAPCE
jgi:hypothetical protein